MNKSFILPIAVILVFLAGSLFLMNSQIKTNVTKVNESLTPTAAVPSIDVSVPKNWVPFTSQKYEFFIRYPLDVNHETTTEGERFYKLGETQSQGTELYDGISVLIRGGSLDGQTFDAFVKKKYNDTKNEPLQPEVGEIKKVTIAGLAGYSYHVRSIGDADFIYLPHGNDKYLEIVNGTVEPANRKQTFQKTVEQMLSTLEMK